MATKIEKDDVSGTATTGHEWDGIKELNTPLPRWWLYTFYATVIWGIAYTIAYPAWPMLTSATPGLLGWSSRAALETQLSEARAAQQANLDKIAAMSVDDILKDRASRRCGRLQGQLRAVPRFWCGRFRGLSQPQRR
jgi:cytochrome c oxidase cbb3-type subunit 3